MKISQIISFFVLYLGLNFSPFQEDPGITFFLVGDSTLADKPYTGSNPEKGWGQVYKQIKPGDYVLIQFGHNDQKKDSPERYAAADTDFRSNLTRYVEEVVEKGGKPILATPITRRSFDDQGRLIDTHGIFLLRELLRYVIWL